MRGCPVIVGRDSESDRLQAALAVDSGITLVSVTGEAGIGKSRLVADVVGTCEDDHFVVRRCGCYLADQGLPFGPFLDLALSADELAALGSALTAAAGHTHAEGPHVELERRRVFDEICTSVRAADCRTIVIVEDVHWADDVSLDALGHLARRMAGSDDRLVITHRPAEEPAGLTAVLAEVSRQRTIEEIELQPLDEEGIAAMAAAMTGADLDAAQRESLAEISDGNPFHIEELLRSADGAFRQIGDNFFNHVLARRLTGRDEGDALQAGFLVLVNRCDPILYRAEPSAPV